MKFVAKVKFIRTDNEFMVVDIPSTNSLKDVDMPMLIKKLEQMVEFEVKELPEHKQFKINLKGE